jgi:uncharacterized membrane protein
MMVSKYICVRENMLVSGALWVITIAGIVGFWLLKPNRHATVGSDYAHAGRKAGRAPLIRTPLTFRMVMMAAVSAAVLVVGLFIILSNRYGAVAVDFACTNIGVVVGFWLRSR